MTNGDWMHLAGLGLTLLAMAGAGLAGYSALREKVREHDKQIEELRQQMDESSRVNTQILVALSEIKTTLLNLERRITREENRH